jgi:hypothetical protein
MTLTENWPAVNLTLTAAPITRHPAAALNGPTVWMEHDPDRRSPAASVIVPVTVVVCAAAIKQVQSRSIVVRIFGIAPPMAATR